MTRAWPRAALLLAALATTAHADRLVLKDGRELTGEVIAESGDHVRFDARLRSSRAVVTIAKADIVERVAEPLPAAPQADDREGEAGTYLVVPITGAFGEDVFARAVQKVLAYAWRHRIQHIVFEVDCADLSSLEETREVYRQLDNFDDRLTYHAVVKRAGGAALAIVLMADTIHPLPGATLGGVTLEAGPDDDADEVATLRRSLANRAATVAAERHRNGPVLAAMLDPERSLAIWLTPSGAPVVGAEPPADLPAELLVARCGPDALLTLSGDQLARVGLRTYDGDVAGLGAALGIEPWTAEGGYGAKTMAKVAADERKAREQAASRFDRQAERALAKRDELYEALAHDMQQAARWDPAAEANDDYATYKRQGWTWNWGDQGYAGHSESVDTNILTKDSKQRWRQRTDACGRYLTKALRAAKSLGRAEERVAKLGLDRRSDEDELKRLQSDVQARIAFLRENRDREER